MGEVPSFTRDDYLSGTAPYELLFSLKDNKFEQKQLLGRMSEQARGVGVRNLAALFKAYLESAGEAATPGYNRTDFTGQALELDCGGWSATDMGVFGTDRFGFEVTACYHPILPVQRLVNIDTGIHKVKIAFSLGRRWGYVIEDRSGVSDSRSIYDPNAALASIEEIKEQAIVGGLASLCIGAGIDIPAYVAASIYERNRLAADEFDAETIQAIIETGLESPMDTNSYKLATALKQKQDAGKSLTAREIMSLYQENVVQVDKENAEQETTGPLLEVASEAVGTKNAASTPETADDVLRQAAKEVTQQENVPQTVADSLPVSVSERQTGTDIAKPSVAQRNVESVAVVSDQQAAKNMAQVREYATIFGEHGSKALSAAYDETTAKLVSAQDAQAGFFAAYTAARDGKALSAEEQHSVEKLTPGLRFAAETAGKADALRAEQAVYFGKDAGLDFSDPMLKRANLRSKDRRMLDAVGKVAGVKVRFVDKLTDESGRPANAQYKNGELLIALNTADPVRVAFTHEVVHRMREVSPEAYNALVTFVQQNMNSDSMAVVQRAYSDTYGTDSDVLNEEIVAQAFGQMLGDSAVMEQFVKDDRNAAQKLLDAVQDMIAAIKRALNGQNVKLTAEQKADFADLQTNLEGMSKTLESALKQMESDVQRNTEDGNKNTASEGGVRKFSIKRTSKMTLAEQLKMFYDNKMPSSDAFYFGTTPKSLSMATLDPLPIAFTIADFKKSTKKKHNIPRRVLKKMQSNLETALFAFADGDRVGVLTADIDGDGKPLLIAIQKNVQMDANKVNAIKSIYGLDHPADWVNNQIKEGKEFFLLDEERANTFLYPYGYKASRKDGIRPTVGNLSHEGKKSNPKNVESKNSLVVARSKAAESLSQELADIREEGARTGKNAAEIEYEVQKAIKRSYESLVDEYGAIPAGENPARDVRVPKKTADNQKVSQTVRTILEAKATPDAAVPTIEELTANGDFSYEVYTDKQAMADAENAIREKGYNSALMEWTKSVQEGEVSKSNTALGWSLYNQAANAGDLKTAMSILTNMVGHQRNAAQAVQATRILKKMSPEAQLYGVQRSAQNLAEELEKRYGKDAPDIQVNEELARKYLEAETDKEREEAMRNLYRDLGRQMPSRFIDKWNAWRYLSMLGNPRTHVRNVLGNAFFAPVVFAKDMSATAIESAVSRVSGGKLDRTKGSVGFGKQSRELLSAAWSDYESVADQVSSGGKYSDLDHSNQYIQEGRRIFKSRALEAARKGNSAALEAEDRWFSQPHYAYALAQYCKAHSISPDMLRAANEGQKNTATRGGKITVDSTEQERYQALKNELLTVADVDYSKLNIEEVKQFDSRAKSRVEKPIRELARKLGIANLSLENSSIDFPFHYSITNIRKSLHHQLDYSGSYMDYAKALSCLEKLVHNAVLIETHLDYKIETERAEDDLKQVYVLMSLMRDGKTVTPVMFEIKEFYNRENGLYMTVTLKKIDSAVLGTGLARKTGSMPSLLTESEVSIAKILKEVNVDDGDFLKYIPDEFLSSEQKKAKSIAVERRVAEYGERARPRRWTETKPHIDRVLLDRARAYAIKEAQKATYRDTNAFSQTISELGRYRGNNKVKKGVGVVLEGILPFRKTPANILVRGLEYSPLGLANGIKQAVWDVKRGNKTAAEAIDSISAGLTGTGLLALGAFLAAQGLVRGSGGDDEEKSEFEELQGHQAYALELPDGTSVTLDWLAPEVLPFFVGVNLWEQTASKGDGGVTMSDILTATANVTEPLLEMSCLQSLNDVFDAVGYASSDGLSALPSALASAATSYLTQGFPTILGQAERTGEDKRMTTYTEKNAFLTPDMQYTVGRISARLPGWDYQQIPYIDAWGRTESTGNAAERAGNNFLNPAYTSTAETSPMEDELLRLYEQTGDGGVLPARAAKYFNVDGERKDLTAQEYVKYATAKGQTAYKVLTALSGSEAYRKMSDAEKVEAVGLVYDYAKATAKTKVSGYKPEGWIAKAVKTEKATGVKAEQYVTLYLAQKGIESLKEADGDTIANSKSLLVMEMVYNVKGLTDAQRRALFEDFGVGKTVIHWNKALVQEKLKAMRKKAA